MANNQKINMEDLITENEQEEVGKHELRQVVFHLLSHGEQEETNVLIMSTAHQVFDHILRLSRESQAKFVLNLLKSLPKVGSMKEIVGKEGKISYVFRALPPADTIHACIYITR